MTDLARAGPFGTFLDIMGGCAPVIGDGIVFFHRDPGTRKGIPDRGGDSQRRDGLFVLGIQTQEEAGFGRRSFSDGSQCMGINAAGMAGVTTYLVLVLCMGRLRFFRLFAPRFMAIRTGRLLLYIRLRCVNCSGTMELGLLVTIEAGHSFLVMDIGRAAEISREFGVYPAPMARGAGLCVIPGDELMAFEKSRAHAGYVRRPHVAVAAGGVAASAGLLKDLLIEYFLFFSREPAGYSLSESGGREVERVFVCFCDLIMTFPT